MEKKMKKGLLILVTLPILAFAAEDVQINSFRMIAQNSSASEICGKVLAPTGHPQMIKIVVDGRTKNPGSYYIWSGIDGKFCSVVSSFSGEAEATLEK